MDDKDEDPNWGGDKTLEDFLYTVDGKDYILEGDMLGYLLIEELLMPVKRPYVQNPWQSREDWEISKEDTTILVANTSDILFQGNNAHEIKSSSKCNEDNEAFQLLKEHLRSKRFGRVRWTCRKSYMQPWQRCKRDMQLAGEWDEEMERLPKNAYHTPPEEGLNIDNLKTLQRYMDGLTYNIGTTTEKFYSVISKKTMPATIQACAAVLAGANIAYGNECYCLYKNDIHTIKDVAAKWLGLTAEQSRTLFFEDPFNYEIYARETSQAIAVDSLEPTPTKKEIMGTLARLMTTGKVVWRRE